MLEVKVVLEVKEKRSSMQSGKRRGQLWGQSFFLFGINGLVEGLELEVREEDRIFPTWSSKMAVEARMRRH